MVRGRQQCACIQSRRGCCTHIDKNRPQEPADHALGRSRGGFGTKLHLVCCGNGVPIAVTVTAGQAHESKHFEHAIATVRPKRRKLIWIAGDKGYSSPRIRAWCERREIFDVIALGSNQTKGQGEHGLNKLVYRGRNVIERTIGHLKENRRIATRFEKLATAFLGMLKLAFIGRYLAIIDPSDRAYEESRNCSSLQYYDVHSRIRAR